MQPVTRRPPRRTGPLPKGVPLTAARKKTLYGRRLVMLQKHIPLDICWVIDKLAGKQERTIRHCIQCGCNTKNFHSHHEECPITLFSRHMRPDWTHVLGTTTQGKAVHESLRSCSKIPLYNVPITALKHEQKQVIRPYPLHRICTQCKNHPIRCTCLPGTIQTITHVTHAEYTSYDKFWLKNGLRMVGINM